MSRRISNACGWWHNCFLSIALHKIVRINNRGFAARCEARLCLAGNLFFQPAGYARGSGFAPKFPGERPHRGHSPKVFFES
jgi:hypothetical protein